MKYKTIATIALFVAPEPLKLIAFILLLVFKQKVLPHSYVTLTTTYILGKIFTLGLNIVLSGTHTSYGIYLMSLTTYHMLEFIYVYLYRKEQVKFECFLINQSIYYVTLEIIISIEYFLEIDYIPKWTYISMAAIPFLIIGHIIRIGPMIQIGRNFNHYIEFSKIENHELVKTGFYSLVRHPSYLGWSIWAVSIQVILMNPVSTLLAIISSFIFFTRRIELEETTLKTMFGQEYVQYMMRVPCFNPFKKCKKQ